MKINFKSQFLVIPQASISFDENNKNSKSIKIFEEILKRLNDKKITISNEGYKKSYPDLNFPDQVDVNILYVDNQEVFDFFQGNVDELDINGGDNINPIGLFCVTTGDGLLSEETYYNESYNVIVFANDEFLKNFIKEESEKDLNPESHLNDYLLAYFNTVTHEIMHALEFIENSGGLTPHLVDCCCDASEFDYDIFACTTGYGLPDYENEYALTENNEEVKELMELRVEDKGFDLLHSLKIDFVKEYNEKPSDLIQKINIKNSKFSK